MDVGGRLRHAREEKGLSLEGLSRATRVTLPILKAIEQNDLHLIPPRPYGRGFVKTYASEVGLDPEQVVREFFSQFTPVPASSGVPTETSNPQPPLHQAGQQSPHRIALMLTWGLAAVLAAIVAAWGLQRASAPETVGISGDSAPPAVGTLGRAPAAAAPAPAPTPPSPTEITISLVATGRSWVTAEVDGRRVIYRLLQPGEREVLRGRQEIRIRTGDAGALRWQIDRGAATAMGKAGEVRTVRVSPAGVSKILRPARPPN
jgi:hypothetical protein